MLAEDHRLKKRKDFKRVYKRGKSSASKSLVIYVLFNKTDVTRIGFSVSKKIGNAVERNRVKRLLREACRLNMEKIPPGYDIIFIARVRIKKYSYPEIEKEFLKLINKLFKGKKIKGKKNENINSKGN